MGGCCLGIGVVDKNRMNDGELGVFFCLGYIYLWILLSAFVLECLKLRDIGAKFLVGDMQQCIFQNHPISLAGGLLQQNRQVMGESPLWQTRVRVVRRFQIYYRLQAKALLQLQLFDIDPIHLISLRSLAQLKLHTNLALHPSKHSSQERHRGWLLASYSYIDMNWGILGFLSGLLATGLLAIRNLEVYKGYRIPS